MAIVSPTYFAFALVALIVYHALPARRQRWWLLIASYAFYAACAAAFLPLLLGLTLLTFAVGQRVQRRDRFARRWLWAGIALNAVALTGVRWACGGAAFLQPFAAVGLAFYSLQAMSYLFDAAAGTLTAAPTLTELALYLAYFPKMVAGPVERAHDFLPKLAQPRAVDDATAARAAALIAIGLTRKLVFGDALASVLPAEAFTAPAHEGSAALAAALIGYAVVLYNDFAGYTNIACGVSALFGIELTPNFAQPFFSRSFTEFWARWHISLMNWMRDYVYMPTSRALLRRNRSLRNLPNLVLPPMTTMLVSGLWHGSGLHMLAWGALHGTFLVVERLLALARPGRLGRPQPPRHQLASAVIVFVLSCAPLVFFRMPMDVALQFWQRLLSAAPGTAPDPRILLGILPSLGLDWMQHRHGDEAAFRHWPRLARAAALAGAVLLCFLATRTRGAAPFVYQGF